MSHKTYIYSTVHDTSVTDGPKQGVREEDRYGNTAHLKSSIHM